LGRIQAKSVHRLTADMPDSLRQVRMVPNAAFGRRALRQVIGTNHSAPAFVARRGAHGEIKAYGCQFDVSAGLSDDASKEVKSRFDSCPKQQTDGADMHHFCVMAERK
jgi:hypothetical protein